MQEVVEFVLGNSLDFDVSDRIESLCGSCEALGLIEVVLYRDQCQLGLGMHIVEVAEQGHLQVLAGARCDLGPADIASLGNHSRSISQNVWMEPYPDRWRGCMFSVRRR